MINPKVEAYWQDMIDKYGPNFIQVFGDRLFWIDNLDANEYPIEMIAHSLSTKCRFGGHCNVFYSVAQHSVIGSRQFTNKLKKKTFLLHDATEAIVEDLITPIKKLFPIYSDFEDKIGDKIKEVYGVDWKTSDIKDVDTKMLVTEASQLLSPIYPWWTKGKYESVKPIDIELTSWSPEVAKYSFLQEFALCM